MPIKTAAVLTALALTALAPAAASAKAGPLPPRACVTDGLAGQSYRPGVNCRLIDVDGFPRRFVVYVPHTRPVTGSRAPLVFMFHGSTGTGEQFLKISGWREQADATGLVAVFPTGLRYRVLDSGRVSTKFNDGDLRKEVDLNERPAGYPAGSPWPADDVGFVDAMVSDLEDQLPIDHQRVYASGFSNGAAFTARLAVERSRVLAAAAFSGGSLHEPRPIDRPIPMYLVGGTLDPHILEHTGPPPLTELPLNPVQLLAEPVIASTVAAHLGTLGLDPSDFGTIGRAHSTSFRWPATGSGADGALFRFAMLEGLAHRYPNARNNPAGFEAAPEFWEFFRTHPLS